MALPMPQQVPVTSARRPFNPTSIVTCSTTLLTEYHVSACVQTIRIHARALCNSAQFALYEHGGSCRCQLVERTQLMSVE